MKNAGKNIILLAFLLAVSTIIRSNINEKDFEQLTDQQLIKRVMELTYADMVGDIQLSKKIHQKVLKIKSVKNSITEAEINAKLGIIFYLNGEYDSAAYFNHKAINGFEKQKAWLHLGKTYCQLGYQMKRRNLNEAFKYYRIGLRYIEKEKNTIELCTAYDNYGVLFEMKNLLDSANFYYTKALNLKIEVKDSIAIPYSYNNLGGIELIKKHYDNALTYYNLGLAIRIKKQDKMGMAESFSSLGDLHMNWNKQTNAISYYKKSNTICSQLNYPYLLAYNYDKISACYEMKNKTDSALLFLKQSFLIKDSINNDKNNKTLIEFEQKFKTAEKDKKIAQLDKVLTEEKYQKEKQKTWIIIISSLLIIVIVSSLLFVQIQKRKSKAQKDAAIITEREHAIELVFAATDEERKRIAKELHDGVGQQMTAIKMNWQNLSSSINNENAKYFEELVKVTAMLDGASADVRAVSHQMMPKSLIEIGLVSAIDDMVTKTLNPTGIKVTFESFGIQSRLPEKIELNLFRITQELVNNIVKHASASNVFIQLTKQANFVVLIVEDNGKGMKKTNTSGIGLLNITHRIQSLNGNINIELGPIKGTLVTIRIPV